MPKRVYVSYSEDDEALGAGAVMAALTDAGLERELRRDAITAAIVVVGPSALNSAAVVSEARDLLLRQPKQSFPIVPLLLDGISLAEVRASGLHVLAGIQMSTSGTLTDRINATLAAIEKSTDEGLSQPAANADHPFTTMRVINAAPTGAKVTSVTFGVVDAQPVVVAATDYSTLHLCHLGDDTVRRLDLPGLNSPVWSLALGRMHDQDILVTGDDERVRIWAIHTGELLSELSPHSGEHENAVQSVAVSMDGTYIACGTEHGWTTVWSLEKDEPEVRFSDQDAGVITSVAFVGPNALVASGSDGSVRSVEFLRTHVWNNTMVIDLAPPGGAAIMAVAALGDRVFGGNDDGAVQWWDLETREEIHTFPGHPSGVRALAAGVINGSGSVVSGGKDSLVQIWDLASRVGRKLEGHTGTVRGVAIGTLDNRSIIVSGGDDGTIRIWGDATADHVEWLSDSPADHDLLLRRPLARSIAARLRRMNDDEPGTSFLVHIDGPWGTGKSTLLRFLQKELEPAFTPVHFNAWSEAGVGPAWWALLTSLRTAVGKQRRWPGRMWLRVREAFARLRRVGAPFMLAFIGLLLVAGLIWWFVNPSFAKAQDIFKSAAGILAMIGTVGAGALVASRFLLWDSARGAKLFEQHNTNPMLEVTRHFGWLMARSKRPVVFFIDDLDRCPDKYVVELLDNVQTLVRDASKRSAHFVVSADGAWIRTSYEQAYEKFSAAVSAPGQPLGYLFLDKFFQLRVPVPLIDAPRQQQYLRELLKGPVAPPQELAAEEDRVREQLTRSTTEAQVVRTLQGASPEVRDRVAGTALDKLSTPAAVAATEHSLQRFAHLLPPNPRTMKRFVNAYSAMRAVRTLEGNPVGVESLALWTIIEIRWPSLADHLRARPESIELVGKDDLDMVPADLRPLFSDAALKLIVQSNLSADVIRSCCGAAAAATDR